MTPTTCHPSRVGMRTLAPLPAARGGGRMRVVQLCVLLLVTLHASSWARSSVAGGAAVAPSGSRRALRGATTANCTEAAFQCKCEADYLEGSWAIGTMEEQRGGWVVVHFLVVLYMFLGLAIVCDEFFVPSLEVFVETYDLPNDIAGATFMAAGGSAPELFTAFIGEHARPCSCLRLRLLLTPPILYAGTFSGSSVGFGTIVGSAVFNVMFVIGVCAVVSKDDLQLTWWPLARDCLYYALSLFTLAMFFGVFNNADADGNASETCDPLGLEPCAAIFAGEALTLIFMYVGYCLIMVFNVQLFEFFNKFTSKPVEGDDLISAEEELSRNTGLEMITSTRFRAGMMNTLIGGESLIDAAAIHVVSRIEGDATQAWKRLDADGNGFIEFEELKALLEELADGKTIADETVQVAFKEMGDTRSEPSQISMDEFADWYTKSEHRMKHHVESVFKKFDENGDRTIASGEMKKLLEKLTGHEVTEAQALQAAEGLDRDGSGAITMEEFEEWYTASDFWSERKEYLEAAVEAAHLSLAWPKTVGAQVWYVILAPINYLLFFTVPDVRRASMKQYYPVGFLNSIIWIGIYSFFMVWSATTMGCVFGIPDEVMGLTFLAAGTSVPDLLTSVIVAKQGNGDMAVSSSIGSNIFDVLIGLPLPWLAFALYSGKPVGVTAPTLFCSLIILFIMIGIVIFSIIAAGWKMTKAMGYAYFVLYALFVLQDLGRSFGWIDDFCG